MAFNISGFRGNLSGDGFRPNLFEVNLIFPTWVAGGTQAGQKTQFMVKSAHLPGSDVGIVPLFFFGRELKLAGNRTFQDWNVQIINDEDFMIHNALNTWFNGINQQEDNVRSVDAANLNDYSVDALVHAYGKTGNKLKSYKFVGIWPTNLTPIDLDWGSNDTVSEFNCNFAVQYWTDVTSNAA